MDPLDQESSQRRVGILPLMVCSVGSKRDQYGESLAGRIGKSKQWQWQKFVCVCIKHKEQDMAGTLTRQLSHGSSNVTTASRPIGP